MEGTRRSLRHGLEIIMNSSCRLEATLRRRHAHGFKLRLEPWLRRLVHWGNHLRSIGLTQTWLLGYLSRHICSSVPPYRSNGVLSCNLLLQLLRIGSFLVQLLLLPSLVALATNLKTSAVVSVLRGGPFAVTAGSSSTHDLRWLRRRSLANKARGSCRGQPSAQEHFIKHLVGHICLPSFH